jgi:GNAT superfamily N-acetyltransferase
MDALARVAAFLQSSRTDTELVGPFSVGFTPNNSNPMLNYAVPVPGADPSPAQVDALIAAFTGRGLLPRLEYLPGNAPAVEPALRAAGFTPERSPLVMVCEHAVEVPYPDGVAIRLAGPADYAEVAAVQHAAYGEPEAPTRHDLDRMARFVERGGLVGMAAESAQNGGTVIAGAHLGRVVDGVAELAAVATADGHRRRGIASALSHYLTATALAGGADLVWLEPEGEPEARMYARIGYHPVGNKLYLSRKQE